MAVEPSPTNKNSHDTSERQDSLLGEFYTEFLKELEQPRSRGGGYELFTQTRKSTNERADGSMGVYFGQKAPLKLVNPIKDHLNDPNEQFKR